MAVSSGFAFDLPLSASGDLSSKQYYFVTHAVTEGYVVTSTGASGPAPLGVLQNDPAAGEEAAVRILGTTQVMADAGTAIGYGDWVTSGSSGLAVVTTGSAVHGMALEALTSGSGVLIEVLLLPYHANTVDNVP